MIHNVMKTLKLCCFYWTWTPFYFYICMYLFVNVLFYYFLYQHMLVRNLYVTHFVLSLMYVRTP